MYRKSTDVHVVSSALTVGVTVLAARRVTRLAAAARYKRCHAVCI
jgi:hypothetical protein